MQLLMWTLAVVLLALAGLMHRWLALAAGFAFLAVPTAQVMGFNPGSFRTEGSPAGMIAFAVYGAAGLAFLAAGLAYAAVGAGLVLRRMDGWPRRLLYGVLGLGVFVAAEILAVRGLLKEDPPNRVERAAPVPTGASALRTLRARLPPDLRGRRELADRALFDECMGHLAIAARSRELHNCANALVAAWDESHESKARFANMPDGSFAARIGELYVASAPHANNPYSPLEGVRAVRQRVEQRFPADTATLRQLRAQEVALSRGAR
jgi:hypothetical protein